MSGKLCTTDLEVEKSTSYIFSHNDVNVALMKCVNSSFVIRNPSYSETLSNTEFIVDNDHIDVNACAGTDPSTGKTCIIVYAGLLGWISMLTLVTKSLLTGSRISKCVGMLHWICDRLDSNNGEVLPNDLADMESQFGIKSNGYDVERQRTIAIAMLRSVIGHECGHICMHHASYSMNPPTVNRNNERAADLFSASIIESDAPTELDVVSAIMVDISFRQMRLAESRAKHAPTHETNDGFAMHPDPVERVNNLISAYDAYLHGNITPKMLRQLAEV